MGNKTTAEKLELIRKNVVKAYQAMQKDNPEDMANVASTLAMQLYSLGEDIAELQFTAESLEAEYKHKVATAFSKNKEAGYTDKLADAEGRKQWKEMYEQYLSANRAYRTAKLAHDDTGTILDVLRTNISLKRKVIERVGI